MRIVIYNSSSFGGCFDYGRALTLAYAKHPEVNHVAWWVPVNANDLPEANSRKIFLPDTSSGQFRLARQMAFLWRVLLNPIKLLLALRNEPPSWVIFNDFEQLSAIFWVPLFRLLLKKKHAFAVILHDPDRDAYPPSIWFTALSMRKIMSLMNLAIYHEYLPQKSYYQGFKNCMLVDLPHGFYSLPPPDTIMAAKLNQAAAPGNILMTILGNIRPEKNYDVAIRSLVELPNHLLVIAGSLANARVNIQPYKDLAVSLQVENRVIWIEKFLTEAEMAAIIEKVDVVLLNYASSFTSQSGILNIVAPFGKKLVVSKGESSLSSTVRQYQIGELVEPGSVESLIEALRKLGETTKDVHQNWAKYLEFASWDNHVNKAVSLMKTIKPNL